MDALLLRLHLLRVNIMHIDPREIAVAESYPTFWIDDAPTPHPVQVAPDEAYSAFVDRTEEELPEDAVPSES